MSNTSDLDLLDSEMDLPWRARRGPNLVVASARNDMRMWIGGAVRQHRYVLRVYGNAVTRTRLALEHRILERLARAGLPFAVPEPMTTREAAPGRPHICGTVQPS